jgi:phosphate transport system protein
MVEPRPEFERQLEEIEAKVIELFAMVAEDLPRATQALLTGDENQVLATLIERERQIDTLYPQIEELVNREIVLQAPLAVDLRYLLSVLRVVPVLERAHDLVTSIATKASHSLGEALTPRSRVLVERMGNLAAAMWRQATDAWYQRDRTAVFSLRERDEEMDELHSSLTAELASGQMAVPVAMEMAMVARDYERVGAHAVNITRRVVYLAGTAQDKPDESAM